MRTVEEIQMRINRCGYCYIPRPDATEMEVVNLCNENGWKITNISNYHFTVEPSEAPTVSGTDWEEVRKKEQERKLKLAERKKRKAQNEQ